MSSLDLIDYLHSLTSQALEKLKFPSDTFRIERCKSPELGDYSTNAALATSKSAGKPPMELAEEVRRGDMLKPIQVVPSKCVGEYEYDLTEGRTRYWAWVIAHNGQIPIPAYIQED